MENKQSLTISLKGLCCANCASKMETDINQFPETKQASINLMKQELHLELKQCTEQNAILEKVKQTVHKYESDIIVTVKTDSSTIEPQSTQMNVKQYARFLIGILFFGGGLLLPEPLSLICYMIAYVLFGADVILTAVRNIIKGQVFDENFLMALATVGAIALQEYSEAVFVMLFYQLGEACQEYALARSRKSILSLVEYRPDVAHLVEETGVIRTVEPQQIQVGQIIQVQTGEKVPLDGVVCGGRGMLDTSALTGESLPVLAEIGTNVYSGSINTDGLLQIEVTKPFGESTVMKILELVEHATNNKSKAEKFITRFARVYTPVVVILAVLLAMVPPLLQMGTFSDWLGRALIFLVVSCPCALVLSVPLTYFSGIGAASKQGILIKGGNDLDTLAQINTMVFDKTGTLTKGKFEVIAIEGIYPQSQILELAAMAEFVSTHPIATAIINAYGKPVDTTALSHYQEKGGYGITCHISQDTVAVGNIRLMKELDIDCPIPKQHTTTVYIAVNGKYVGYILVADTLKTNAKQAIQKLSDYGIQKTVMLTGDKQQTAKEVATQVGIQEVYAELLPWQKSEQLEKVMKQNQTGKTAFVGDGINDAPVLAGADLGIAMGGIGSDAAIEAADVVLMDDDLQKLCVGMRIAKNTRKLVKQNIAFALGIKIVVMILGAMNVATMWMAVFADVGVAVLAVCNAMRKK